MGKQIREKALCKRCKKVAFTYFRLGKAMKKRLKIPCFSCLITPGLNKFMSDCYPRKNGQTTSRSILRRRSETL